MTQFRVKVEQLNRSHLFVCIRVTTSVNQLKASIVAATGMEIYQQDLSLAVDGGEYKKLQDEKLAAKACGLVDGSVLLLVQNQNEGASPGEYNTNVQSTSDSNNTYEGQGTFTLAADGTLVGQWTQPHPPTQVPNGNTQGSVYTMKATGTWGRGKEWKFEEAGYSWSCSLSVDHATGDLMLAGRYKATRGTDRYFQKKEGGAIFHAFEEAHKPCNRGKVSFRMRRLTREGGDEKREDKEGGDEKREDKEGDGEKREDKEGDDEKREDKEGDGEKREDNEGDDEKSAASTAAVYSAKGMEYLDVSAEIKELFQYIQRYKPHHLELESLLKCFLPPGYIPSVGQTDPFLKVPRPDDASPSSLCPARTAYQLTSTRPRACRQSSA
jgi:hypothetical protein